METYYRVDTAAENKIILTNDHFATRCPPSADDAPEPENPSTPSIECSACDGANCDFCGDSCIPEYITLSQIEPMIPCGVKCISAPLGGSYVSFRPTGWNIQLDTAICLHETDACVWTYEMPSAFTVAKHALSDNGLRDCTDSSPEEMSVGIGYRLEITSSNEIQLTIAASIGGNTRYLFINTQEFTSCSDLKNIEFKNTIETCGSLALGDKPRDQDTIVASSGTFEISNYCCAPPDPDLIPTSVTVSVDSYPADNIPVDGLRPLCSTSTDSDWNGVMAKGVGLNYAQSEAGVRKVGTWLFGSATIAYEDPHWVLRIKCSGVNATECKWLKTSIPSDSPTGLYHFESCDDTGASATPVAGQSVGSIRVY